MPPATLPLMQRLTALRTAPVEFEMVIDNFAGIGGAGMGIEAGLGHAVDVAINHNKLAIEVHKINHPGTKHYIEDVFHVNPVEVCAGRKVGLAWFSPDCTHFSRAKGGKPVSKKIRGLAWVVIKWAALVRPRVIILENVPEFRTWGPLDKQRQPIKARRGETFRKWWRQFESLGYKLEDKDLTAADFGAPTIRKRLFIIARCDNQPIVWPKPTHAKRKVAKALKMKPWVGAFTCIDWDIPTKSIFERKRPLADATQRRIFQGLKRYVFEAAEPFIVTCNHQGESFRGQGLGDPMNTVTGARDAHGIVEPYMVRTDMHKSNSRCVYDKTDPLRTITSTGGHAVVMPHMVQTGYGERKGQKPRTKDLRNPMGTVVGTNKHALVSPFLSGVGGPEGSGRPKSPKSPMNSVLGENHSALVAPHLVGIDQKHKGQDAAWNAEDPARTIVSKNRHALVKAWLLKQNSGSSARDIREPLPTLTTGQHDGVMKAKLKATFINKHYTGAVGQDNREPMGTVTAQDHHSLTAAHLLKFYGTNKSGADIREAMPSITANGTHIAEVRAFMVKYFGTGGQWGSMHEPAATVTTKARLGLVTVQGQDYQITDIGLRMLDPIELLRAQFGKYAKDYVLIGTQERKIAGIGNSVCPELAEALVKANVELQLVTKLGARSV